jgi:hypothetical protein
MRRRTTHLKQTPSSIAEVVVRTASLFNGLSPVDCNRADGEVVVGTRITSETERVPSLTEGGSGDRGHPVLPAGRGWDIEPRESVAVDEYLVAVGTDIEHLKRDIWIDDGATRNGEGVLARTVADELGPRDAEGVRIDTEVFMNVDQRVIGLHWRVGHVHEFGTRRVIIRGYRRAECQ